MAHMAQGEMLRAAPSAPLYMSPSQVSSASPCVKPDPAPELGVGGLGAVLQPETVRLAGRKIFSEDLYADRVVMFQHRNYTMLSLGMCFAFPTLVGASVGIAGGQHPDCIRDRMRPWF
jgi:hypothetical protein